MSTDDMSLMCGYPEITECIVHGDYGMTEAMETFRTVMPVIQVVIVEKGTSDKCPLICFQMEPVCQMKAFPGNRHTVFISGDASVLAVGFENLTFRAF